MDRVFHCNIIPDFVVKSEHFYVIIIMPVIHYCMSGLKTNCDLTMLGVSGKVISGLCVAGKVAGGVVCLAFDHVVAVAICRWMFGVKGESSARALPRPARPLQPCAEEQPPTEEEEVREASVDEELPQERADEAIADIHVDVASVEVEL